MKKYEVRVKGNTPLIWNVLKRELELEKKELKKNELSEWEENPENWKRKAEFNEKGNVIVPERWLKGSLIDSCKKNRIIPHFATRKNETYTSYVKSCMVFTKGSVCKKEDLKEFGAYVGAQGANSTTKVWRVRPMIKTWDAEFTIIDPAGRMKQSELEAILGYAGMMIGMGDNRINNFGRFDVVSVEESV